jgi:AcrR family transcriptional regulator
MGLTARCREVPQTIDGLGEIDYGLSMVNTGAMMPAGVRTRRPYRSPEREARARSTRQRVIGAATALFGERGYAGTTIGSVAAKADVSVPTIESLFGTKSRLLKASIDVAIAGDDEPVPMLERDWATAAEGATDAESLLSVLAAVLAPAQARSSGLVLSVFEGAGSDPELGALADEMSGQRAVMAAWVVDRVDKVGPLRRQIGGQEAVDTVYAMMEPAVFDRLIRRRGWSLARYQKWIARSLHHLLVADEERPAREGERIP